MAASSTSSSTSRAQPTGPSLEPLTRRRRCELLRAQLDTARASWISHWAELARYILPRRAMFSLADSENRGSRVSQHIIDSTATFSARTLASGMMSGMTSPARPWFRLVTGDPDLDQQEDVKAWLHQVGERMQTQMLRSNLYKALPICFGDIGVFGTHAFAVLEDDEDVFRCYDFPIGSYYLATDGKRRVRVFLREFRLTVRQMVERFGRITKGVPDWGNFSLHVRGLWESGQREQHIDLVHCIEPNDQYDPSQLHSKYKRFASYYYERGVNAAGAGQYDTGEQVLLEEGFDEFPIIAARWEVAGEDVYGTSCPGMIALGDIKQLQLGERRSMQAVEKTINPPLVAPSRMRNTRISALPSDVTYDDSPQPQGIRPLYQVAFNIEPLEKKQEQARQRIAEAFFTPLFLLTAESDRRDVTAREIDERHEEKMLVLGPVLEQFNQDGLDPLIERIFAIMHRRGMIPPPPEALHNVPLRVEYISIMAQAQKMVSLAATEHFLQDVNSMVQTTPGVLDKVDTDAVVDELASVMGVNPKLVRATDAAQQLRQQRQQAAASQAQSEQLANTAKTAQTLSQTDTQSPSALTDLIKASTGVTPPNSPLAMPMPGVTQ